MIVKKIKNPRKSASKAVRIRGLSDYIVSPERAGSGEKCLYAGSRGFLTADLESQQAEMLALSQEAVRSPDTLNHYVLSWREGEQPSPQQVEQAVDIFLDELGLKDHQAIYGLHADTDNLHLHLAVNRVHPDSLKVVKPDKGFDIEAAHRAIARIEHEQGWQREAHARYVVKARERGGELELARAPAEPDRPRQPASPKRDMEQRTGEKSAERIGIEEAAPVIQRAANWRQLHQGLAERGMRYEKTGSGAMLFVGEVALKASSVDREASLPRLQKRLGPYEPAPERQVVAERAPEPLERGVPGWHAYITDRAAHLEARSAAQHVAMQERSQRQEGEKRLLVEREPRLADLLPGDLHGLLELRQALHSVIAAEQAGRQAELAERHRAERRLAREQARQRFGAYPDLEQWQRQQGRPEAAERWRYRASEAISEKDNEPQRIRGRGSQQAMPRDIRGFEAEICGPEVHYRRRAERETGIQTGPETPTQTPSQTTAERARQPDAAFIDRGAHIDVYDWQDADTTLAALQLGAQKWGQIEVEGSERYKALVASLAVEHGFEVVNPELQARIKQLKQERSRQERINDERTARLATRSLAPAGTALGSYQRHYLDVRWQQQDPSAIDPSRLDAIVAVRMRVTGYEQGDIEAVLRLAAAGRQRVAGQEKGQGHDPEQYAKRTVQHAYSAFGERQAAAWGRHRQQWKVLEERARPPRALEIELPARQLDIGRDEPERDRGRSR